MSNKNLAIITSLDMASMIIIERILSLDLSFTHYIMVEQAVKLINEVAENLEAIND